jgi:hypothetical protein
MNKKSIIGLTLGLLAISGGLAVWQFFWTGKSVMNVTSTPELVFIDQMFEDGLDTTDAVATLFHEFEIDNTGQGPFNGITSWTIEKTDIEDGCLDYENDCEVTLKVNGYTVTNGDTVLYEGDILHKIKVTYSCLKQSCPQDIQATVTIQPV